MDNWMDGLADGIKKVLFAGVGAVAAVSEKAEEVVGDLVKKGELTVEQGKKLCEKIAQDIKAKCSEVESEVEEEVSAGENLFNALDALTPEQRAMLRARLDTMDEGNG